jgi:hypothetical protein
VTERAVHGRGDYYHTPLRRSIRRAAVASIGVAPFGSVDSAAHEVVIGNKTISWSLRLALAARSQIPFEEVMIRFGVGFGNGEFTERVRRYAPTGRVPVLVDDDLSSGTVSAIASTSPKSFEKSCGPKPRR